MPDAFIRSMCPVKHRGVDGQNILLPRKKKEVAKTLQGGPAKKTYTAAMVSVMVQHGRYQAQFVADNGPYKFYSMMGNRGVGPGVTG